MRVRVEPHGSVQVAVLSGDFDLSSAGQALATVADAVDTSSPGLVLDLSNVEFIDSGGVGALFRLGRRLSERRQELRLAVPADSSLRRVLTVVQVDRVAPVHDSADDAVAAIEN